MKILLVEDDDAFIKVLTRTLKAQQYIVDVVKDGEMGWTYGSTFDYDLMVLDVVLPKLDGISLCKRFRAEGYATPILLLTSQDSSTARVQGLDSGADDYVVKPFDRAELVARIRALRRRGSANPFPLLTWGDLILNPSTCEVSYKGQPLALTTKEYELLELMMRDSQHVFSTEELLDHLWSSEKFPSEATVRSHIRRVRHKLMSIGAPQDFIATMHGRGYYLKATGGDDGSSTLPPASPQPGAAWAAQPDAEPLVLPSTHLPTGELTPAHAQQQYLAFLNETWQTTKPNSLDQVARLLQTVQALQTNQLTAPQQNQAQHLAHKLAGTLGLFGLHKAVHLSRQLEYWLGGQDPLLPNQAPLMNRLVLELEALIQETTHIVLSQIPNGQSPLLLLVSADDAFNQSLRAIASGRGIQVEGVPPLDLDKTLAALELTTDLVGTSPDVILLRLLTGDRPPAPATQAAPNHPLLRHLQTCRHHYPSSPIVTMGDRIELGDRLRLAQSGSRFVLDSTVPPEQVVTVIVNLLQGAKVATKVMIVDDDHAWLRTLPTLLKPWGFKVTTLADPTQFWTVLQSVAPDALVLDVNMPDINGFELCQILRSDPHWQRLPVLFLSAQTDTSSQQQAFQVGADDYLCKPLLGGELAHRILNRLQRARAWAN